MSNIEERLTQLEKNLVQLNEKINRFSPIDNKTTISELVAMFEKLKPLPS